jgi:ATP-dependent exoDNAse (exonuclease V) alpha subunit
MIAFARDGRGTRKAIGSKEYVFDRDWLNESQKAAVMHVLQSHDTVTAVTGGAGTGKSSLMEEAADAIRSNGKEVFVFAPSTGAREVLTEKGFDNAQTVEHLLRNTKLHPKLQNQVMWIDESGLLDVRSMNGIFDIAAEQNCRVVLSGDTRQHASPRRGEAMRMLETEAGLNIARVEEIQRQKGRYKKAVELISLGHEVIDKKTGLTGMLAGFDLLDQMGKIHEIAGEDRHAVLAETYLKTVAKNKSTLVIAPTHAEGRAVTEKIREELRERKLLSRKEVTVANLRSMNLTEAQKTVEANYQPDQDMVLQFHQNVKGGYKRGERYRVVAGGRNNALLQPLGGGPRKPIPLEHPDRFEVYKEAEVGFAVGDKIRFTLGGTEVDGKRKIANGRLDEVAGFDANNNLELKSGLTVASDYGHLDLGYYVSSHAAQGKDRDVAIAAIGSKSMPAVNARQFYVSVSRGRKDVAIYVDDKAAVRRAIQDAGHQLSATQLVSGASIERQRELERGRQQRKFIDRVRGWWQSNFPRQQKLGQKQGRTLSPPELGRS